MSKTKIIIQQDFDKLLNWLDSDREIAGQKYEVIRTRLTKIFKNRGSHIPAELADQTIDRVIQKLDTFVDNYEGNPELYFYGVAKVIFLEQAKTPKYEELNPFIEMKEEEKFENTEKYQCLIACLPNLPVDQRQRIIEYYRENKRAKIESRKKLAEKLGESQELLRIQMYRIRTKLQKCIEKCLGKM